jgi:glycosyltransferase involved in cell wall biosynthesis
MKKVKKKKSALEKLSKEKIKVLTISDHPLSPSGVGTQTKYIIEGLLESDDFEVVSLGGAIKHQDYNPLKPSGYDNWTIYPVDGYGNPEIIRSIMRTEKPDIMWFMTDPRFYTWLWDMEDEIRANIPMVYYHVWDNYPVPYFNEPYYNSTDAIVSISKLTQDIVEKVSSEDVYKEYLPHSVDTEIFQPIDEEEDIKAFKHDVMPEMSKDRFVFFFNSRNARRKQTGSLIFWFKSFLDEYDAHDKACLLMHTDPRDQNGQDLLSIIRHLNLTNGEVVLSQEKVDMKHLALMYNMADCTVNISDAEGFGLSTLESLACGTPIIATETGGLQDQIRDSKGMEFGIPIKPVSKAVIGSQDVPWIYEDRLSEKDVVAALGRMYETTEEERQLWGAAGRLHVMQNFNFKKYKKRWANLLKEVHEKHGSWPNEKYNRWTLKEIS